VPGRSRRTPGAAITYHVAGSWLARWRVRAWAIGLVMLGTAAASTLAVGLVAATDAPFDHAFTARLDAVAPEDAEVVQVGDAVWQRAERRGLVQGTVRPVLRRVARPFDPAVAVRMGAMNMAPSPFPAPDSAYLSRSARYQRSDAWHRKEVFPDCRPRF
jgi:hypothetical protein